MGRSKKEKNISLQEWENGRGQVFRRGKNGQCLLCSSKGLQENKKIFRVDSALDMKRQILAPHQSEKRQ